MHLSRISEQKILIQISLLNAFSFLLRIKFMFSLFHESNGNVHQGIEHWKFCPFFISTELKIACFNQLEVVIHRWRDRPVIWVHFFFFFWTLDSIMQSGWSLLKEEMNRHGNMLPIQLLGVSWQSRLGRYKIWLQKNVFIIENLENTPTKVWKQVNTSCIISVLTMSLPALMYTCERTFLIILICTFWVIFFHAHIRAQLYLTLWPRGL